MPSLLVPEKEDWKERLDHKIDKKMETLIASEPGLLARIGQQARQQALQSLGLAQLQAELDALAAQKGELQRQEQRTHQAMLAVVRRVPINEVADGHLGSQHPEVSRAIQQRQAAHEEDLLAQDERGLAILRLRREKENLLDAIWLATAPPPLQELWKKLTELLGEELTQLQATALASGAQGPSV